MKTNYLVLGVLGALLFWVGHSCGKPKDGLTVAIDTLAIRINVSDSVQRSLQPRIAAAEAEASRKAQDAVSARSEANRLHAESQGLRDRYCEGRRPCGGQRTLSDSLVPSDSLLVVAYDTLLAAYDACTLADQSCQAVVAQKDSIIGAERQIRASLEAVRDAGRAVVKARPSFLSRILPKPSFGYGVTLSRLDREIHDGIQLGLTWTF